MLVYLTDNCNPTCSDGSYWFGNAPNDWWLQPTSHGFFSAPVIRSSFWTVVATWPPKRSPFPCPWRYLCLTCTYRHCSPCCWHLHSMSSYLDCLLTPLSMSDSPTNQTILKHLVHINIPIFWWLLSWVQSQISSFSIIFPMGPICKVLLSDYIFIIYNML